MKVDTAWLDGHRDDKHRRSHERKLKSVDEARAFVHEMEMVTLFGIKDLGLPSLYDATLDTEDFKNTWWGWKDTLCSSKDAFYGRLLQKKVFLSTWDLFRAFYALSGSSGELDEYKYEYKRGRLGITAKHIYEHLMNFGPTATDKLRSAVRMSDKNMKGPFDKAMADLQGLFYITKVGAESRGWGVDVWEILPRWIPGEVEASLRISGDEARSLILDKYLRAAAIAPMDTLKKTMAWDPGDFESTVRRLSDKGTLLTDVEFGEELVPSVAHAEYFKMQKPGD